MTLGQRTRAPSYAEVVATPPRKSSDSSESSEAGKNKVKVVVRIRPENASEGGGNSRVVVKAMNENVLVFDPKEQTSPSYGYRNRGRRRDIRKRQCKDLKFAFDHVFDHNSANHNVYEESTKQILDGLLDGYNCSVFAYGATGAGKTHTMLGNPKQPGVIYLTMMDLYTRIGNIQDEKICDVAVSYLEVYNEQIHDLLVKGGCLPVREDAKSGVTITGLSLHTPRDAQELLHMLHFGNQNRTQHPTDANAESSRSHAVFQVFVRQRDRTANVSTEVRVAKMCLVDLAGSERATVTKNCGARFREGANINRSLLALGNCINALADSKYKGYVPYRDSKLTRLLKDSLGGNCQTVMIAAVSPSSLSYEDTYNTLKYADRAKHIQTQLKKNVLNVDFHVARYGQIIKELRKEINELKGKLQSYEDGKMVVTTQQLCTVPNKHVSRLKENMEDIFLSRLQICREYLDSELKSRDMRWIISRKERCLARMACFNGSQQNGTTDKLQRMIHSAHERMTSFVKMKEDKNVRLAKSNHSLEGLKSAVQEQTSQGAENPAAEILKLNLQIHESSLALTESQHCMKYMAKVVRSQEREISGAERLVIQLLQMVKQQHSILKDHDLLTPTLDSQYHTIQSMTEGREVTFADQSFPDQNNAFSLGEMLKSLPAAQHLAEKSAFKPSQSSLSLTSHSSVTDQPLCARSSVTNLSSVTVSSSIQSSVISDTDQDTMPGPSRVPVSRRNVPPARVQRDQPYSECKMSRLMSSDTKPTGPILPSTSDLQCSDDVFVDVPNRISANSIKSSVGEIGCGDNEVRDSTVIKRSCVTNVEPSRVLGGAEQVHMSQTENQKEASQDLNSTFTLNQENIDQCVLSRLPIVTDRSVGETGSGPSQPLGGSRDRQVVSANSYSTAILNSANKSSQPINTPASSNKSSLLTLLNMQPVTTDTQLVSSANSSTKTANSVNSGTVTKGGNPSNQSVYTERSSCVRSIQFDGACTTNKVRSYAEVASSPLCGRVPLQQMNSNTPLAIQMTLGRSRNIDDKENTPVRMLKENLQNTPTDGKLNTPGRVLKASGNQLSRQATDNSHKERPKLQQMGLFSMSDRLQEERVQVSKGTTPGYMRMTKAASGRFPSRFRQKSQSTTNLARRGWQL